MKYNFDELVERKNTNSVKWDFTGIDDKYKDEVLPLSIADMDFPCAQPILDSLAERVNKKIFGYSMPDREEYMTSVTSWFKRRHDYEIDPETMVSSPGIVPALGTLIRILSKEGDGVIVQQPIYYPFNGLIESNKRKLVINELINNDGYYTMDFEDLEKKVKDPNNTLMLFCSPHNPVGRVWKRDELQRLVDICIENDVYIVSDEIHCDLLRKDVKHIPTGAISRDEKIISCIAASKSFNLAGLQMSNILLNSQDLRDKWKDDMLMKNGIFGAGVFGIEGTKAAYNHGEEWLDQARDYIDGNLAFVKEFLDEHLPEAKYLIPEGTYFAWIDLRPYGYNAEELEDLMVNKAKLILDEGYIFGQPGAGFERLNVACPKSVLEECLVRMRDVIK